jgi:translation elongation factor EF-1alpha
MLSGMISDGNQVVMVPHTRQESVPSRDQVKYQQYVELIRKENERGKRNMMVPTEKGKKQSPKKTGYVRSAERSHESIDITSTKKEIEKFTCIAVNVRNPTLPHSFVRRGDVLGNMNDHPPMEAAEIIVQLVMLETGLRVGYCPSLHCGTGHVPCRVCCILFSFHLYIFSLLGFVVVCVVVLCVVVHSNILIG